MNKTVKARGVVIGEGMPKICVPLVGESISEITLEAEILKSTDSDVVEWRADFYEHVTDVFKVKEVLQIIRSILPDKPLIFTFRSAKEGGHREISEEFYAALNKAVIETMLIDIVDVELFKEEWRVRELIEAAHEMDLAVIVSNHDFLKTPPKEEIIGRLRKAMELGGDIAKIAVMPASTEDVLTLLDATRIVHEQHADCPIVTMSMSEKGVISRLSGELFGSALTFGALKKSSAPGQISVKDLRRVIELLHNKY